MEARCYINNDFMSISERSAPQAVQNTVIRDYCKASNIPFGLSKTEYAFSPLYPVLFDLLSECQLEGVKDIVIYSLFNLPEKKCLRERFLDACSGFGITLHFASEKFCLSGQNDFDELALIFDIYPYITNWKFGR